MYILYIWSRHLKRGNRDDEISHDAFFHGFEYLIACSKLSLVHLFYCRKKAQACGEPHY